MTKKSKKSSFPSLLNHQHENAFGVAQTPKRKLFGNMLIACAFWLFVFQFVCGVGILITGLYLGRGRSLPCTDAGWLGIIGILGSAIPFAGAWILSVVLTISGTIRAIKKSSIPWWTIVSGTYMLLGIGIFVLIAISVT
jgi:hypothetical protein